MEIIRNMPTASIIVVLVILSLFAVSVIMLLFVCAAYRRQTKSAAYGDLRSALLCTALENYKTAYKTFGEETNTPAIISSAINTRMGFALFCERFLGSAVSLFVTLGLFGTFLGLSMSVSSLTKLISFSNSSEWLGVLDSVGGGLMSALSGMGVAFYTSLVGVACSIVLTVLRAILSPESLRSALEAEMELLLDHRTAPRLATDRVKDDTELAKRMIDCMNNAVTNLRHTLDNFNGTVGAFNQGVRDFSEFDYNLRGTVERLDVAVRDLSASLRRTGRDLERSDRG